MGHLLRFMASILVLLGTDPLWALWIQTNGPYGGNVHSMATIGENVVAGVYAAGMFLSTNNGADWRSVTRDITPNTFLVSDDKLFAGGSGVYVSVDSGFTWKIAGAGAINNCNVRALALSGSNLFAGADFGGGGYLFIGTVGNSSGFGTLSSTNNAF
jgi:hypothetical protein